MTVFVPATAAAEAHLILLTHPPLVIDKAERNDRAITTQFLIGKKPDGTRVYAKIRTGHYPNSRAFSATLTRIEVPPRKPGDLPESTFGHGDFTRLTTARVARYSAKGLREFNAHVLADLTTAVAAGTANADLLRHFRPAGAA